MPYEDPDPTDPMTLHGVAVETDDDRALREMAACFVEEYARLGFDSQRIMAIFKTSGYAGPHMAFQAMGEAAIDKLIADTMGLRRPRPKVGAMDDRPGTNICLPVLDQAFRKTAIDDQLGDLACRRCIIGN